MNTLFFLRNSRANEHKQGWDWGLWTASLQAVCATLSVLLFIFLGRINLEFLFTLKIAGISKLYSLKASHKNLCFHPMTQFCFSRYRLPVGHLRQFSGPSGMCKYIHTVSIYTLIHTALTPMFHAKQEEVGDLASEIRESWWENPGKNEDSHIFRS